MLFIQFMLFTILWFVLFFSVCYKMYIVNFLSNSTCLFHCASSNTGRNFVVYYMYFRILGLSILCNNVVYFHLILNVLTSPIVAICSEVGDNLRAWATMGQRLSSKINFLYGRTAKENYCRKYIYFRVPSPFSALRVRVNFTLYWYICYILRSVTYIERIGYNLKRSLKKAILCLVRVNYFAVYTSAF